MLQVRVQEILTGPQIAHGGPRCVRVGTELVDHLGETEVRNVFYYTPGYHLLLQYLFLVEFTDNSEIDFPFRKWANNN